jgi:hypothetical protein
MIASAHGCPGQPTGWLDGHVYTNRNVVKSEVDLGGLLCIYSSTNNCRAVHRGCHNAAHDVEGLMGYRSSQWITLSLRSFPSMPATQSATVVFLCLDEAWNSMLNSSKTSNNGHMSKRQFTAEKTDYELRLLAQDPPSRIPGDYILLVVSWRRSIIAPQIYFRASSRTCSMCGNLEASSHLHLPPVWERSQKTGCKQTDIVARLPSAGWGRDFKKLGATRCSCPLCREAHQMDVELLSTLFSSLLL